MSTRASSQCPDALEERLLCWRCNQWFSVWHGEPGPDAAERLRRAVDRIQHGHTHACNNCVNALAVKPSTANRPGSWMLEVQAASVGRPVRCVTFHHVGYMRMGFACKSDAAEYYAVHNPHMRPISARSRWCSDWDPETRRRYVVRRYCGAAQTVDPF
jgi:hypothetical protein